MILRALFGNKEQTQAPQPPAFEFSPTHPIFQEAQEETANKLLESSNSNSPLSKLICWFRDHTGTSDYVSFRIFTPEKIQMIHNYDEIRQISIKTQILKGIDLIIRQEKVVSEPEKSQLHQIEHPFPNLSEVRECNELWRRIRINDALVQDIDTKINIIAIEQIKSLKLLIAAIVSLLTSVDAIPANYIPIVNFKGIDMSNKLLANKDATGRILQQQTLLLQQYSMPLYKAMNQIEDRYASQDGENLQPAMFQSLLESFRQAVHPTDCYVCGDFYEIPYLDFLNHPNCLALAAVQHFKTDDSDKSFLALIRSLVSLFEVSDPSLIQIIYSLSSFCLVPLHLPKLKQSQNMMEVNMEFAFEFIIETDPIRFLSKIAEWSQTAEIGIVLQKIVEGLTGFTNSWMDIFKYVIRYSIPDYLPPHLVAVRTAMMNCLSLYQ
ncbi:hypothetical protein TRFO_07073 [Tritrichomonas foetus]|uniref:Uncharacterized protein n=1 Tax=Tritrichomonas foetus TaxID=1144522 RepID=A0A1J4JU35_9EUKA|nr:hypothetical protein TRFO_07073 [Tritrichomonas foetus]|eukprot:OHT02641.1 hypothetical protein TRFO_07073 [Tritrichomonas foetus]